MPVTVVIGAQWGDEGKAKVIDLLSKEHTYVVRYQGGHNAGHTVVVDGEKYALQLVPSGILYPHVIPVIGNGVVVDMPTLFNEVDMLESLGNTDDPPPAHTPAPSPDPAAPVEGLDGNLGDMTVMRRQVWNEMGSDARAALMHRGIDDIFDPELRTSIGIILEDVRRRGDAAVCDALAKFDGIALTPDQLRVSTAEFEQAVVSDAVDEAIDDAIIHLRTFNEAQMQQSRDWSVESEPGLTVGEKITPISSVGLFTPSGKASYPSVAYQLAVPAVVAGVPKVSLVVPPVPGGSGEIDPAVLVVCRKLGIENVFRVNGPAGIAALGFGTESIDKVVKIVGPGSPAVTIAQVEMQRFGTSTMMLLGPTESLVIADETADPVRLAADLLIEAEHGTDSSVVLLTTSAALADATDTELDRQLAALPEVRATACRASLGPNGGCVLVDDLDTAIAVANEYAAEHLQVAVADADIDRVVDGLVNAGEILIGQDTPFSAANFILGCPASLPTSGFAHVASGITANAFLKRTAIARSNGTAIRRMASNVIALADHEGFPAHANALHLRNT